MKKFNKIDSKYANFLRFFIMIALGILGALLIVLMFGQLLAIGQRMIRNSFIHIPIKVLDEIVTFFLFF